jgi:hypothetical protein
MVTGVRAFPEALSLAANYFLLQTLTAGSLTGGDVSTMVQECCKLLAMAESFAIV